jgi:large subunit ribosomal protein L31
MKPEIHPKYNSIEITCLACSTKFSVGSTRTSELKTEVCSNCHPFFTGKQLILDTAGQVERFQKRLGRSR